MLTHPYPHPSTIHIIDCPLISTLGKLWASGIVSSLRLLHHSNDSSSIPTIHPERTHEILRQWSPPATGSWWMPSVRAMQSGPQVCGMLSRVYCCCCTRRTSWVSAATLPKCLRFITEKPQSISTNFKQNKFLSASEASRRLAFKIPTNPTGLLNWLTSTTPANERSDGL